MMLEDIFTTIANNTCPHLAHTFPTPGFPRLPTQEMFAFPVLEDIFTTIANNSEYQLHCK